jgi:hypothetical protein
MEEQLTFDFSCRFGNYNPLNTTGRISAGYLLGSPIQITIPIRVTHLGLISFAKDKLFIVSLYSNANNLPCDLLTQSEITTLIGGRQNVGVSPVYLLPGTYWYMAQYKDIISIGKTEGISAKVAYTYLGWGAKLPITLDEPESYTREQFNYYILGEPWKNS